MDERDCGQRYGGLKSGVDGEGGGTMPKFETSAMPTQTTPETPCTPHATPTARSYCHVQCSQTFEVHP